MGEFLANYGLWILLGGIFVAMHMFGMGCCGGGHQHGPKRKNEAGDDHSAHGAPAQTKAGTTPARPSGGCH
jgi:hypothetical protein